MKDRDATRSLSERKREKVGFIETMGFTQSTATPTTGSSLRRHVRYVMMMFMLKQFANNATIQSHLQLKMGEIKARPKARLSSHHASQQQSQSRLTPFAIIPLRLIDDPVPKVVSRAKNPLPSAWERHAKDSSPCDVVSSRCCGSCRIRAECFFGAEDACLGVSEAHSRVYDLHDRLRLRPYFPNTGLRDHCAFLLETPAVVDKDSPCHHGTSRLTLPRAHSKRMDGTGRL